MFSDSVSVCLSVCVFVYMCAKISERSERILTKLFVEVVVAQGTLFLSIRRR